MIRWKDLKAFKSDDDVTEQSHVDGVVRWRSEMTILLLPLSDAERRRTR